MNLSRKRIAEIIYGSVLNAEGTAKRIIDADAEVAEIKDELLALKEEQESVQEEFRDRMSGINEARIRLQDECNHDINCGVCVVCGYIEGPYISQSFVSSSGDEMS
jgi:hypothetical protein